MTDNASITIRTAETDSDIHRCFDVLSELRPNIQSETFVATIRRMQSSGYSLVMLETDGVIAAVTGYRFGEHLARGKFLYVDDLVTAKTSQGRGYGRQLFERLVQAARSSGCRSVELDSGVQRTGAHRFYDKVGMSFNSHHYGLKLV